MKKRVMRKKKEDGMESDKGDEDKGKRIEKEVER